MGSSRLAILLVLLLATIQVVLAQLDNGQYLVVSAIQSSPPPFPIGIDHGSERFTPVVVGGLHRVWTIQKEEGEDDAYTIEVPIYGQKYWLRPDGNKVVANLHPPPAIWRIQKIDGDKFVIQTTSNTWSETAFTIGKSSPGTLVELKSYEGEPTEDLLWRFIRVGDFKRSRGGSCRQYPLAY